MNNEIGSQLKNLRERKGLTIAQVAYAVDETHSEVEFWESGKLKPCANAKRKLEFLFSRFDDDHNELAKVNEENHSAFLKQPDHVIVPKNFTLWLKAHGFFVAPASLGHHGNQCGGLFAHSNTVAEELKKYTANLGITWVEKYSPWIVGMFHDICKIDDYMYNYREDRWEWNKNQILTGHGEKSLIMLQRHFTLTEQEIACIRWHMGSFTDQKEWEYYGRAVERYPTVLFTHTADMYASHVLGV